MPYIIHFLYFCTRKPKKHIKPIETALLQTNTQ